MRFGLNNLGSILAYGLSAVGLIFSLLVLLAGEESLDANVSASIWVTIAMFLVAIAVAVLSSVRGLLINPASLRGALVGVGLYLLFQGAAAITCHFRPTLNFWRCRSR